MRVYPRARFRRPRALYPSALPSYAYALYRRDAPLIRPRAVRQRALTFLSSRFYNLAILRHLLRAGQRQTGLEV